MVFRVAVLRRGAVWVWVRGCVGGASHLQWQGAAGCWHEGAWPVLGEA